MCSIGTQTTKGQCPQFWAHVCCGTCGQTAGWIKMPLGADSGGLGPAHIELDGDRASPQKGAQQPPPTFWPMYCGQTSKMMPVDAARGHGSVYRALGLNLRPTLCRIRGMRIRFITDTSHCPDYALSREEQNNANALLLRYVYQETNGNQFTTLVCNSYAYLFFDKTGFRRYIFYADRFRQL